MEQSTTPIRVALVEDDQAEREQLANLLGRVRRITEKQSRTNPNCSISNQADNGREIQAIRAYGGDTKRGKWSSAESFQIHWG